jgi:hypothetical protein
MGASANLNSLCVNVSGVIQWEMGKSGESVSLLSRTPKAGASCQFLERELT